MKIYTNVFDLARICPRRFWVAPYSVFKIGVKIAEKGAPSAKSFAVKAGLTELTPDEDKVDGFTTYALKSADTGFVEYTIEVEGVSEKLKLVQITTDSTVFEVGGSGGGDVPADVATKTWVNSQISDFVDEDWVESQISDFVEEDALTAYATKDELTAYAETADLTAYAEKTDLTAYAEKTDLTAYYTKSETSSAAEIQTAIDSLPLPEPEPTFTTDTVVKYVDGTISSYSITGNFYSWSIGNISDVKEITFGTSISSVAGFSNVSALEAAYIPPTVAYINALAFNNTVNLKSIVIPDSVITIGSQAFYHSGIKSAVVKRGLKSN